MLALEHRSEVASGHTRHAAIEVNLAHALVLVVPPTSLLGAYCGWQHIKVQRRMAFEASQMQLLAMLQFPPPPLLPQLPGLPGHRP